MGTWIKETNQAIYLMEGGYWVSRLTKHPSKSNPDEQVLNIQAVRSWFMREDYPRAMTVALESTEEPQPTPTPPPSTAASETDQISGTDQINDAGLEIIKHFEGRRLQAYQDSVGIWTIGYGHTSAAGDPQVRAGMVISEQEAEDILKQDLELFEAGVRDRVNVALNSDQFSALVSFSFNVGLGAFGNSTLLRKLNAGDYPGAANEFTRWVKAGGTTLPGLVRRRDAEKALFLSQNYKQFIH
ncbi:lysozyme [Halomicronema sp. CCY15110]|uniref:lysozyme n=1 Tax=Halomicronema sp. CCY15110 TaxID=2767773 RepID=UPI00194E3C3B|nr:lysozyme [Halomicronema sp. CCY15110]